MSNKKILQEIKKNLNKAKAPAKKADIDYVSKMGYRDDSPFNKRKSITINTPDGSIDMSNTGKPLLANGKYLPPYSGVHQFNTNKVTEEPLEQAKKGGSRKYSKSLLAKNRLFEKNKLFKKKNYKNKIYDPSAMYFEDGGESGVYSNKSYKAGGSSEQKIIFAPNEGGCPDGQYWTGTECKPIPKNTKIVYSQEELNKLNISKKEQQRLYNEYIGRINKKNAIDSALKKKYGPIQSKEKFYSTFESIPGHGFSPMMSYGPASLTPDGLAPGIPSMNETMVDFKTWKKMLDKSPVKPIGYKGHPGGGHFYPIYEKPTNYILGYNREEKKLDIEPIKPPTVPLRVDNGILPPLQQSTYVPQEPIEAPQYTLDSYTAERPYLDVQLPQNKIKRLFDRGVIDSKGHIELGRKDKTRLIPRIVQKVTGYDPEYFEGSYDEEGNYIPGELDFGNEVGGRMEFRGAASLQDLINQQKYAKDWEEYERKIDEREDHSKKKQEQGQAFKKGGTLPKAQFGPPEELMYAQKGGITYNQLPARYAEALKNFVYPEVVDSSEETGYFPDLNIIKQNPNDPIRNINNPWWYEHELMHHLQNLAGGSSTYGSVGLRPNPYVASDEAIGSYYDRRGSEFQTELNRILEENPDISEEEAYTRAEEDMYRNPNTEEGEARNYEGYIEAGNPSIFPKKQKGGQLVCPIGYEWNGIECIPNPFETRPSQRAAVYMDKDGNYQIDPAYQQYSQQKFDVSESNRKAQEFNKLYAQSKNYKRLLKKQGYTPEEIKDRINSVMNINDFRYIDEGPSWVSANEDTGNEFISYNVTDPGDWPGFDQIAAHEWGHVGVDSGANPLKPKEREEFINRINKEQAGVTGVESDLQHDMEPQENRADLVQLRQQLQEAGVFDSTKRKKFTKKDLNKYREIMKSSERNWDNMWNRMFRLYDDDSIIHFMNNVAKNNSDQDVQVAKYGVELDLTEDEIKKYVKGGYVVEDISVPSLTRMQPGGEIPDSTYTPIDPNFLAENPDVYSQIVNKPEVSTGREGSDIGKLRAEYRDKNPMDKFLDEKKRQYLKKNKGLNKAAGVTMENFPEVVLQNFIDEYEYKTNNYAVNKLGKKEGWNPKRRGEWVDELTPGERDAVAESKYGSKLQPSYWSRSLAGVQELGNTLLPGQPFQYNIPGLTKKEQKEMRDSKLSALETLAPIDIPGAAIANLVKNTGLSTGSDYKEQANALAGEKMANVSDMEAMAFNPLTYAGVEAIPELGVNLVKGVGRGVAMAPEAISNLGKFIGTEEGLLSNAYKLNPTELNVSNPATQLPYDLEKNRNAAAIIEDLKYDRYLKINSPEGKRRIEELIANNPHMKNMTYEDVKQGFANMVNENAMQAAKEDEFVILNQKIKNLESSPNPDLAEIEKLKIQANNLEGEIVFGELGMEEKTLNAQMRRDRPVEVKPVAASDPNTIVLKKDNKDPLPSDIWSVIGSPEFTVDDLSRIIPHEFGHYFQQGAKTNLDNMLSKVSLKTNSSSLNSNLFSDEKGASNFFNRIMGEGDPFYRMKKYWKQGGKGQEKTAFMEEVRADMLQRGMIEDLYQTITPELLKDHYLKYMAEVGNKYPLRIYEIMKNNAGNFKIMSNVLNKMPALVPIGAVGAGMMMQNNEENNIPKQKRGGIVSKLSEKKIKELIKQGYIIEEID